MGLKQKNKKDSYISKVLIFFSPTNAAGLK